LSLSFSDIFGRVVCSGFCVVLTVVFGCSLSCLYSFLRMVALLGAVAPYTYTVLPICRLRTINGVLDCTNSYYVIFINTPG